MRSGSIRVGAWVAVGIAAVLALSGCTSDKLAANYGATNSTNFTDGSGQPVLIAAADRTDAIDFTSKTVSGSTMKLSDYRGKVVVINFWYAGCAPCRAEAPILRALSAKYTGDVQFIGVNTVDQAQQALSFDKTFQISYPSVLDVDSGAARIAFAGSVAPTATPTTFVLDTKGRVAARIVGQLESQSILNTLLSDTLAESK